MLVQQTNVNAAGDEIVALNATQEGLIGALTETAPGSDTASSGLNGRLQRIAQRLTSLIGLFPGSLGQKTMTASLAVVIASDQSSIPVTAATAGTGTLSNVVSANTSTTLLAQNTSRKGFILYNDSNQICRVAFAGTASATSFTLLMQPNALYVSDILYTGIITGIWAAANGNMRVTELT